MLELYFWFRFWSYFCQQQVILHPPTKFYDVILICQAGSHSSANLLPVSGLVHTSSNLRKSKTICTSNFDKTSQSTAEILLLSVPENK